MIHLRYRFGILSTGNNGKLRYGWRKACSPNPVYIMSSSLIKTPTPSLHFPTPPFANDTSPTTLAHRHPAPASVHSPSTRRHDPSAPVSTTSRRRKSMALLRCTSLCFDLRHSAFSVRLKISIQRTHLQYSTLRLHLPAVFPSSAPFPNPDAHTHTSNAWSRHSRPQSPSDTSPSTIPTAPLVTFPTAPSSAPAFRYSTRRRFRRRFCLPRGGDSVLSVALVVDVVAMAKGVVQAIISFEISSIRRFALCRVRFCNSPLVKWCMLTVKGHHQLTNVRM